MGGAFKRPPPPAGGGKSRGPAERGFKLSQNVENMGDREGENTAALCTVVFVLSSKNHRRGVCSATYVGTLWSKNDF